MLTRYPHLSLCTLGFREAPLRGVWEGWMETKGPWNGVGFRIRPLRAVYVGVLETNSSIQDGGFVIWPGKIGECKEYGDSLHSERKLMVFGVNIDCDCKENDNSLLSRIKGDIQRSNHPSVRMRFRY